VRFGYLCSLWLLFSLLTVVCAPTWDTFSDTWVATDGLGRTVPTHHELGAPRAGKTVGVFYFLWLGSHGRELYDIAKIVSANPDNPQYGPRGKFHFWGEPLFGYYLSDDRWVLRKHAQMLTDSGVDVLMFDVTNGFTYDDVFRALCKVFGDMRADGLVTPQIAFLAHSGQRKVVQRLYDNFYQTGAYRSLWFRWQGKPLVLADPQALTPALRRFFTVRESWAWTTGQEWFGDGKDKWPWLDHHPQTPGWHADPKTPEFIPVAVAQHPVSNIGRSFHDGHQPVPDEVASDRGWCFAEQWRRALTIDPEFLFITGWNEWVAQRFVSEDGGQTFLGRPVNPGGTFFVDQYNQEFSRDIEPMRDGHGDNYYYQMVSNIRRYKGARPIERVRPAPIVIDGRFEDWRAAHPEFRDTLGDPVKRRHPGWSGAGDYVNETGRHDLMSAKVSFDESCMYFHVRTRGPLTVQEDLNWMQLFIDVDADPQTGWMGYDLVIHGYSAVTGEVALARHAGEGYKWEEETKVSWAMAGSRLELAVPRESIGAVELPSAIDFKWADNLEGAGDWTDFMLNGDVAPNDRFNYRARLNR
jgi:hypothetical protein